MPDKEIPENIIINTLVAGEISPDLYGRTDLTKFHQSAMLMRNFFVNYKGGASTRPGTQFIGNPVAAGKAILWPFQFSAQVGQTYMLVFSSGKLQFVKNPGGLSYPNSSNSGWIMNGLVPYSINTPYAEADLPFLKFSQVADQLTITRKGYKRRILSRITDTNWTLTIIDLPTVIIPPTITNITISPLPAGSPDPQNTRYAYVVTSVDANGNESIASVRGGSPAGINIATTQGTVSLFWNSVVGAKYYKVYKGLPSPGNVIPGYSEQLGFAGYAYGPNFVDSNIVPDFTRSPPRNSNPFVAGAITGYNTIVSSADWPVNTTTLSIADPNGTGAVVYPVLGNNIAGTASAIIGIVIEQPGSGYTAPVITAAGGGTTFTANLELSPSSGIDPDVVGLFQQRQVYAATINNPNTLFGSRPDSFNDFRKSNPITDSDAYEFTIASQQVNSILWLQSMPGGLVVATNSGIVQLTGGSSSASNPLAVTPTSAVVVPQSYYGAADINPIVINYDILYVQAEGGAIRDLQYNFFVNIYTGTDITTLSSHLFYPYSIVSWCYQDTPTKTIWAARSDGTLLSLAYLKEQEILGWAQHTTKGASLNALVESVASVREGTTDAVYLSVNRNGTRFIERLCDRLYGQVDDAWCLDSALSTVANYQTTNITLSDLSGNITITSDAALFVPGNVGSVIRVGSGKATITAVQDQFTVFATVDPDYLFGEFTVKALAWRMDPPVANITGLSHLNGFTVFALVDGKVQGPFVVANGIVNLTTAGTSVVIGLPFSAQLQTPFIDVGGERTIQGKRKKLAAVTVRTRDATGLKYGSSFGTLRQWAKNVSSTDAIEDVPYKASGLTTGDQRLVLDQTFNTLGSFCIQQDYPLPATILAIIPELALGDI